MDPHRLERLSEAMREELSELIGYEMGDPRVNGVGITGVLMSADGRHAVVRVSVDGEAGDPGRALLALDGARGYLRRELARRLELHHLPELRFEPEVLGSPARMRNLFKKIKKGRPRPVPPEMQEKKPS